MKGKFLYRALKIGTVVCAALAMLILLGRRLMLWWAGRLLGQGVQFHTADGAGSIGIIGGADGPTAIFTTSTHVLPPMLVAGVLTVLSVVGCAALFLLRRNNK